MNDTAPAYQRLMDELVNLQDPSTQKVVQYFFKTEQGQYGEGDKFLGIKVPVVRATIKPYLHEVAPIEVEHLLHSEYHEVRMAGLLVWVNQYKKLKDEAARREIVDLYLRNTRYVNNWDLVDLSCEFIVGEYLLDKPADWLFALAKSENLWEQRIAIVSTLTFIRKGRYGDTLALCEGFLDHQHDLIHKASGWCLREIGKRDEAVLREFLEAHAHAMPRTMLRYSIEKMNEQDRKYFMEARARSGR
ncbi:DNA alkylation repair protein [uncultured Acetobacteroides sp.]|uniref:DNA alkylation repair protein n=1 Tax=uncultured Acetobacteroides sp. TaxID=1760811 RepID=UPI0029F5B7E7|nr:DNA alkylation repair protein [uncultured Acetobacteroides sp.]